MQLTEPAPAKVNLALHVRGKLPDGRHRIETVFAFCIDGDVLAAEPSEKLTLLPDGPFAGELGGNFDENLVIKAARALQEEAGVGEGASLILTKKLPVASGIGGGSADAAAALRLLTRIWGVDPSHAAAVAPNIGSDVPACLLSMTSRGDGAGDELQLVDAGVSNMPILLVNPRVQLSTREVFAAWNGQDKGPLENWRAGRNDLEAAAVEQAPARRRRPRMAFSSTGRRSRPHVGERSHLLRLVRERRGARPGRSRGSARMVAARKLPALRRAR